MSELCRRPLAGLLPLFLLSLLVASAPSDLAAQGPRLLSMNWHGPNLVLKFSDSVAFTTDPVESDSGLTLRFDTPVEIAGAGEAANGPVIGRFNRRGTTFRLEGNARVGYSMLWGPYSNSLVIYTFDWDELSFAEKQFHLGLTALEQGLPNVSAEYLSTARNADTGVVAKRAAGVLGLVYERTGQDSLAALYLGDPQDQDMWGARSSILRRSGDTAAAAAAERQMAAATDALPGLAGADAEPTDAVETSTTDPGDFLSGWPGIALLVVAGLLILVIATMFARRPPKQPTESVAPAPHAPETTETPTTTTAPPVTPVPTGSHHDDPDIDDPDIEHSTPPPSPEEAEEIIEKEVKGKSSSIAQIYSPPSDRTDKGAEALRGLEEEQRGPAAGTEPTARGSRQADALRQMVRDEKTADPKAETPTEPPADEAETDEQDVIAKARKMNVSRDHVELKNRLKGRRDD